MKLHKLLNDSRNYKIMHKNASRKSSKINKIFSIATIILVTATASGFLGTLFVDNDYIYKIISAVVLFSVAILNSVKDFLGLSEKPGKHKLFEFKFSGFIRLIEEEIERGEGDGSGDGGVFNLEFDNLVYFQPDIPDSIYKHQISKDASGSGGSGGSGGDLIIHEFKRFYANPHDEENDLNDKQFKV